MASSRRQFKLTIWGLAVGYFLFYAAYSGLLRSTTEGLLDPNHGRISGFQLLPTVNLSAAIVLFVLITFSGWWKHVGHRKLVGFTIPFPHPGIFLSGIGTAIIISTTTLAFTFTGVSILFALLLMRGGVLTMAPIVDRVFRRRVRWFSWTAFSLSVPALLICLIDVNNHRLTGVAALTILAYLAGYLLRLPCLTKLAKTKEPEVTRRYFAEEMMIALPLLVAIPAILAIIGEGEIMMDLRRGFSGLFVGGTGAAAFIVGALYAGLYCFGTLIYLDCRENTFCIALNRGSSMLAGVLATFVLSFSSSQSVPSEAQLVSAGLIVVALLFLSPLHHFRRVMNSWSNSMAGVYARMPNLGLAGRPRDSLDAQIGTPRLFLFVCSGNTCRSPMAAAICNAEIAQRLKIPLEDLETVNVRALSAGISAKVGAPLTPESQEVLRSMNVPVGPHAARSLTVELANQADLILCMTSAHRKAIVEMIPSVAGKTYCLDHEADIEDPIGKGLEAYLNCALRIRDLVRLRFDELGVQGGLQS